MHPNLIAYAVPVFFAAIVGESLLERRKRHRGYRFGSAIADLDTGIVSQVVDIFLRGIGLFLYALLYEHRWVSYAEGSAAPWVVGLVGIDFAYYWWHRLSHVVNVLWAVHAVHHQSQDFNFAVALRQPAFEALTIIPFHLPLALLGVKPWIYVACYAIDLIYQFWIHTELVRRVAWLEWVLNTPSCHRVHHGINPQYLDRNFGGILVVWDRIFGTYEPEQERAVYGVTHPLASYNPVWANFAPWRDLARLLGAAPTVLGFFRVLFAHPAGRVDATLSSRPPAVAGAWNEKYDPPVAKHVHRYVLGHFAVLALGAGLLLSAADRGMRFELVLPGALVVATTLALCAWTEGRAWAWQLDVARQVAAVAGLFALLATHAGMEVASLGSAALVGAMATWFAVLRPDRPALSPRPMGP